MTFDPPISKKTVSGVVGVVAILFYLWLLTWSAPANAMGGVIAGPEAPGVNVHQVKRIFKRDRTPVYPYSAKGPGRRGWSSYIGFVPYSWGNVENEAIQRNQYPMRYWPHNQNAPLPRPYR
ncbi:hypothetical protein AUC70_03550 [Methyloceanibacter stevinii]|uniref:Uncharacterized protein n=1 Tax=Methyloceanibacter stevinii TaxID=1774970 RepID=A0A1E3VNK3_9HYPH|nr:hypothetical protein [Methyloceanibacter stevinii]ODR94881.1 hypothetical protein AUC70_03550 [Methyloceanibacter stevinii]